MASSAELEEDEFFRFLAVAERRTFAFNDELYARCLDAVDRDVHSGSPRDIGILVRQVLRRQAARAGGRQRFARMPHRDWLPDRALWEQLGVNAIPISDGFRLEAEPWKPEWLEDGAYDVDMACLAGTDLGRRRRPHTARPADPMFFQNTGHETYSSPGQCVAVRAAITMDPGDTLIAMLPTGSGKTEIALTVAGRVKGTTVIIVPTVALALDFERRFRDEWVRRNPSKARTVGNLSLAWTSYSSEDERDRIRRHLSTGRLPWLVTSPEALAFGLGDALRDAARAGRLGGFVVDEAHLITQWGRDFRADFRELPSLRQELVNEAGRAGYPQFVTLLLSATLGDPELNDLTELFGDSGQIGLVAANQLRAEPDFWVAEPAETETRKSRLFESVDHLPRPLVLYATKPDHVDKWREELHAHGYDRVAVVTGRTAGQERQDVMNGIRANSSGGSRYDMVIATSAFGLGIDYSGIRSVVHACVPETMDRWYQEVGRGGRDGDISTALLVPAESDFQDADSLGVSLLTNEVAAQRWEYLWSKRKYPPGRDPNPSVGFVNVSGARPGSEQGSYNRRWNRQVLQALEETGAISREVVPLEMARQLELSSASSREMRQDVPEEWEEVTLLRSDLQLEFYFSHQWSAWREKELAAANERTQALRSIIRGTNDVCTALREAYLPGSKMRRKYPEAAPFVAPKVPCGSCRGCRARKIPPPDVPSIEPPMRWPAPEVDCSLLERLLSRCNPLERLAVLVSDDPISVVQGPLGRELGRAGIRYVAGLEASQVSELDHASEGPLLIDPSPPCEARFLPPLPGLVVLPHGYLGWREITLRALRPLNRDGVVVPLVMICDSTVAKHFSGSLPVDLALEALTLDLEEQA